MAGADPHREDAARVGVDPADPWLGRVLERRYRLEQSLGTSATYRSYRARDRERRRSVKVVMLHERIVARPGVIASFLDEARAISRIGHAGVVKVEDFGRADDSAYLVNEWMAGPTLDAWMRSRGPLTWVRARPLVILITRAVAAVHRRKVIHGALRLQSCFVIGDDSPSPEVRVGGFGFSSVREPSEVGAAASERDDVRAIGVILVSALTREGTMIGSLEEARARALLGLPEPVIALVRRALIDDGFDDARTLLAALEDPVGHASGATSGAPKPRAPAPSMPKPSAPSWPAPLFSEPPPAAPEEAPTPPPARPMSLARWMEQQPLLAPTAMLSVDEQVGGSATTVFDRHSFPAPPSKTARLPARGPEGTVTLDPALLATLRGEDDRQAAAPISTPPVEATQAFVRDEVETTVPLPSWRPATIEPTAFLPRLQGHVSIPPAVAAAAPLVTEPLPAPYAAEAPPPAVAAPPAGAEPPRMAAPPPEHRPVVAPVASAPPPSILTWALIGTVIAVAVGIAVGLVVARTTGRTSKPSQTSNTNQ